MKIIFIFSCSGMFRNVPACSGMFRHVPKCSVFRVLSTANLFGCVSKTSCGEYLVKDIRSEKMTQLIQAPLTALFLVVSLSILYRKHFCVFVF